MDDTIYRHAAIDVASNDQLIINAMDSVEDGDMHKTKRAIQRLLASLPSAQPEIIRCKDCKHYQFADNRAFGMPVKMCEWFGFEDVDDNDFCSRAERRTDE